ncbi:hypothetical protein DITRI_Ditri02bG0101900 [Diplodiscus trichospermus]
MVVLKSKHINVSDLCPRCGGEPETIAHALRGCVVSRAIWDCAKLSWDHGYGLGESEAVRFLSNAQDLNYDDLQNFVYYHGWFGLVGIKSFMRGIFKVNFDGALKAREMIGGIGVIIRNDVGEVFGALSASVARVNDSLLIEARAAVTALQFSVDMGFR